MTIRVVVAGATGWTGSLVAKTILQGSEFTLTGAIARRQVGSDIGRVLGLPDTAVRIAATLSESLRSPADVLIDYSSADSVKSRVLDAIDRGIHVVIGTSGLTDSDYEALESAAVRRKVGVIAAGNFSITAALAKHFALIAAKYLPSWEVIDYAGAEKPDAPSGTTRELAEQLSRVARPRIGHPLDQTIGEKTARGANIAGTQVHSIRLPGFVIGFETLFGQKYERLSIRHDAGEGADPYVTGTLLAARRVVDVRGLVRGLDTLLF